MVNLNRQIAVARARAGGFSAHVLPAAISYEPGPMAWTLIPAPLQDGSWMLTADSGATIPLIAALNNVELTRTAGPTVQAADAGPGSTWLEAREASISPTTGKFTLSAYITASSPATSGLSGPLFANQLWSGTFPSQNRLGFTAGPAGSQSNLFVFIRGVASRSVEIGGAALVTQWNHYALSVDGTNWRLYFNGAETESGTVFGTPDFSLWDVFVPFNGEGGTSMRLSRFEPNFAHTTNFTPPQL